MDNYPIEIPNTKIASQRVVTLLLLLMNVCVFGYISFAHASGKNFTLSLIGAGVSALALMAVLLKERFPFLKTIHPGIAFILCAIIWAVFGKFLLTVLMLLFGGLAIHNSGKLFIHFSPEGIRYPSFPEKLIPWKNVAQVLLKDDVLTIDLKDNKLMQFNLDRQVAASINTQQFNEAMGEWVNL